MRGQPGPRLTHGQYSALVQAAAVPELSAYRAALASKHAAIVEDLGGVDATSVLARDLVRKYLQLDAIAEYLAINLEREGALTAKGRQRAAVSAYLSVVDRQMRIGAMLGLARVPRDVHESVHDFLARLPDEAAPSTDEGKEDTP